MKAVVQVFSLSVVSKVLLGAGGIILIRFLPKTEYADYTLAISFVSVVSAMLATGFNNTYIVGYKKLGLGRACSSFLTLQLGAIALLAILAAPFAQHTHGLYWLILSLVSGTCLMEFSRTYYQQGLRFLRFSLIELARALVFLAAIMILIALRASDIQASQVLGIQAATLLVVFAAAFGRQIVWRELVMLRRALGWMWSIACGPYRYLFGYTLLIAVMTQLDIFMLKAVGTNEGVATYGSAFRYCTLLSLALAAVHTVFLPVIQTLETSQELRTLFRRHLRLLLVFVPVVVLGALASRWIIPMIDLGKYPSAIAIFQILAASSIVSFMFSPHVNLLLRFEDFRFLFALVGASVIIDAILNVILIPISGGVGAAWATLMAFAVLNFGTYWRARRHTIRLELDVSIPG